VQVCLLFFSPALALGFCLVLFLMLDAGPSAPAPFLNLSAGFFQDCASSVALAFFSDRTQPS